MGRKRAAQASVPENEPKDTSYLEPLYDFFEEASFSEVLILIVGGVVVIAIWITADLYYFLNLYGAAEVKGTHDSNAQLFLAPSSPLQPLAPQTPVILPSPLPHTKSSSAHHQRHNKEKLHQSSPPVPQALFASLQTGSRPLTPPAYPPLCSLSPLFPSPFGPPMQPPSPSPPSPPSPLLPPSPLPPPPTSPSPTPPMSTADRLNARFRRSPFDAEWPADGSLADAGLLVHIFDGWEQGGQKFWLPGPGTLDMSASIVFAQQQMMGRELPLFQAWDAGIIFRPGATRIRCGKAVDSAGHCGDVCDPKRNDLNLAWSEVWS